MSHGPVPAAVLPLVDRPEDGTADLVVAAQQPVGHRQHFAAGIPADRGQPHRGPVEEQGGVAGRLQQVQDQEHGHIERVGDRAGGLHGGGGAAGPQPLAGQYQGREADQAEAVQAAGRAFGSLLNPSQPPEEAP